MSIYTVGAARHEKRNLQSCFWTGLCKKVEDAPSHVEKQIDDSGAQMKAGSVVEMEKADEFERNELVINDYKKLTVKYAQDKLSKQMEIQKSRILNCRIWKTGLAN